MTVAMDGRGRCGGSIDDASIPAPPDGGIARGPGGDAMRDFRVTADYPGARAVFERA